MDAPINGLLEAISDLDQDRIVIIARTLGQTSVFNEVVREQTQAMEIGERDRVATVAFNSLRAATKKMDQQSEDQKIGFFQRTTNLWVQVLSGEAPGRVARI